MTNDQLLQNFLDTWPLERVKEMTLEEYNKSGSRDTFCYMLEYGTRSLGNISGTAYSSKFEIYERKNKNNIPQSKDYGYDTDYTWRNRAGVKKTREQAFLYTRGIIYEIVEASQEGKFSLIDEKGLAPLVVWKIAFLYSKKRLLSISDRKAVKYLADLFGMEIAKNTQISSMHRFLMRFIDINRYWDDMYVLWSIYLEKDRADIRTEDLENLLRRKGVTLKDIKESFRKSNIKEIIITKRHNKIQQKLYNELVSMYGIRNVTMEEANIDLKVDFPDRIDFYEVKIASSAKYCIREALGQIIEYAYNYQTEKRKKLIVVGNHSLINSDINYVDYLKSIFNEFEFEYRYEQVIL
ncbi:hypothetical protein [uncultured Aquimarina sp.]|uniref:hypothetical protein n=1 Tax=uncultured Aquimarina sp. TaxID=575652 RepID=UPI00262E8C21|nr:hypothetical protein [uncultured Aquimarina sp.]